MGNQQGRNTGSACRCLAALWPGGGAIGEVWLDSPAKLCHCRGPLIVRRSYSHDAVQHQATGERKETLKDLVVVVVVV